MHKAKTWNVLSSLRYSVQMRRAPSHLIVKYAQYRSYQYDPDQAETCDLV